MSQDNLFYNLSDSYRILFDVTAKLHSALSLPQLADLVMAGAVRLGFERAYVRLYDGSSLELVGSPSVSDSIVVPLWNNERCLGILALDNGKQAPPLSPDEGEWLKLFGDHVAAALDRVLILQEKQAKEQPLVPLVPLVTLSAVADSDEAEQILFRSPETEPHEYEKEVELFRSFARKALTPQADEDQVIKGLLDIAKQLLKRDGANVEVVLRSLQKPNEPLEKPTEIRRHYFFGDDGQLKSNEEPEIYQGLVGDMLRAEDCQLVTDVRQTKWAICYENQSIRSELLAPIRSDVKTIGVLRAAAPMPAAFTEIHQQIFERLAAVASLAIDNMRRQNHLYDVLQAISAVTAALDLKPTWKAIIDAVFNAAPGLSALTIWYKDPLDGKIKLGTSSGLRDTDRLHDLPDSEMAVVEYVMNATAEAQFWVPDVSQEFQSEIIAQEQVKSVVAFPLYANNDQVGAMFLYYRQKQEFGSEEKALFPILASIVAASILEANLVEKISQERDRFEAASLITEAVGTTLELDETLQKVMTVLRNKLFPQTNICVMTYQEMEQALTFTPSSKEFYRIDDPNYLDLSQISLSESSFACAVANASLKSQEVEVINLADVTDHSAYLPLISQTRSTIGISLISGNNHLLGVLLLESPEVNHFDTKDEVLLSYISRKISLALERVYQSAELQFQTSVAAATSWAAEIAHDLKNEVGLIRFALSFLKKQKGLSKSGLAFVEQINQSAVHLGGLLSSVSVLQSEHPQQLPIDKWIEKTVWSIISQKNKHQQITIHFELGCAELMMKVAQQALYHAIRHLIRNALEAIEQQTDGQLTVRTNLLDHQKMVEIQIEDSGNGIADSIWQTLFQKPKSTKKKGGERGYGLLFARHIIQQMGGTLKCIAPTSLSGACFAITLPVRPMK